MRAIVLLAALVFAAPAFGADWYVVEGAEDGDGTKEKPFKDPSLALDKAVPGDTIHVAQGSYSGKLKIGYLMIDKVGLTLVGGYKDKAFAERNPFLYPTFIKEDPANKNSSFAGGYIRIKENTVHDGTTVDGFWFDRADQNAYNPLTLAPPLCPGCLKVPLGSNTKPIIEFEGVDCHIRNSVFMNSALYAVRLNGDGSSLQNNLFLNVNYAGVDIYGKGRKVSKGPFHSFTIKNNTFVSAWNGTSQERAAGAFIVHNGNADIATENNIFHLSNGNASSMGWAFKDERNFKNDKWIHMKANAFSQLRGGIISIYDTGSKASFGVETVGDLSQVAVDASGNDKEEPGYTFDKQWLEYYIQAVPKDSPSNKKVDMNGFNQLRRMAGLPLDGGVVNLGGAYLAWKYPVAHVKTGAFFKTTNEKLKGRGLQADGPFAVVKSKTAEGAGGGTGPAAGGAAAAPAKEYQQVTWEDLLAKGESMADQAVAFKAYWTKTDQNYASGFGKTAKSYLEGATKDTHKIYVLRRVDKEADNKDPDIRAFVPITSPAIDYMNKKAMRQCQPRGACEFSFVVKGTVKAPGAKMSGKGPNILIAVDDIVAE